MNLPIIVQFLVLKFGIDALKTAPLNTPSSLNSSFSVIGVLIPGDLVMNAGWLVPEIILHMAFVAFASFTQPSCELDYVIELMRMMLLVLTAISPAQGFWLGIALTLIIIASNRTVTDTPYFYPLSPFNPHDFRMIFTRKKLCRKNSSHP